MNTQIPWGAAVAVFMGTLPLLGVMIWNMMDVRTLRTEMRTELASIRTEIRTELASIRTEMTAGFASIRSELSMIRTDLTKLTERVAILEERDRRPIIRN